MPDQCIPACAVRAQRAAAGLPVNLNSCGDLEFRLIMRSMLF